MVAPRGCRIQHLHNLNVWNAMGMPAPIRRLILIPSGLGIFDDVFNVLEMLDSKVLTVAVEMNLDAKFAHSSVTQSVPAVAVIKPAVAALIADIF